MLRFTQTDGMDYSSSNPANHPTIFTVKSKCPKVLLALKKWFSLGFLFTPPEIWLGRGIHIIHQDARHAMDWRYI